MKQVDNKLRRTSFQTVVVCAIFSLFVLGSITGCQSNLQSRDGMILECELLGGTVVKQPPGSPITACCYENGCWICDENGNDCEFDPVYSAPFWVEQFKLILSRDQ